MPTIAEAVERIEAAARNKALAASCWNLIEKTVEAAGPEGALSSDIAYRLGNFGITYHDYVGLITALVEADLIHLTDDGYIRLVVRPAEPRHTIFFYFEPGACYEGDATKVQYSHRNGEALEPTVEGWFIIDDAVFETEGYTIAYRTFKRKFNGEAFLRGGQPYQPSPMARYYGPLPMPIKELQEE